MKKKIATLIMAAIFCTTICTARVNAEEAYPANFALIEQEVKQGIVLQNIKTDLPGCENVVTTYYITAEGETFESISSRLAISEQELIQENSDYRVQENGSYLPFAKYAYVAIPEVPWGDVSDEVYYYISKGDTLSEIANYFGTTLAAIQELNPEITDVNKIYADTVIKIK